MTPSPASASSGSLRCFLALLPEAACRDDLQRSREPPAASPAGSTHGMRWVDPSALHLTLRFLGDTTPAQVGYFKHLLPALVRALPAIATRRCAIWPNRARPRLLVLELETCDELLALALDCEAFAQKAGFDPETRAFKAHMTLARLRPSCLPDVPPMSARPVTFESLALMASERLATGARNRSLASVKLPATGAR